MKRAKPKDAPKRKRRMRSVGFTITPKWLIEHHIAELEDMIKTANCINRGMK